MPRYLPSASRGVQDLRRSLRFVAKCSAEPPTSLSLDILADADWSLGLVFFKFGTRSATLHPIDLRFHFPTGLLSIPVNLSSHHACANSSPSCFYSSGNPGAAFISIVVDFVGPVHVLELLDSMVVIYTHRTVHVFPPPNSQP